MQSKPITRRRAIQNLTGGATAVAAATALSSRLSAAEDAAGAALKGRINHSVCKWCYGSIPLDPFCAEARRMGLKSVELLTVDDFPTLKKYDLVCAMVSGVPGGITKGLNRLENHDPIVAFYAATAPKVAAAGFKNIICFSGNRGGMSDEQGLENCAVGLQRVARVCEQHGVVAVMELLNSKVDHADYMCDHTAWGVELCKRVGSEHFKLLYDIYHMQIMEGDVIRTIKGDQGKGIESAAPYIAHYHTGGVPGRNEIDESQELYYPAIMQAIADTGFKGFVAQEFIPARTDKLASLNQGVQICDV
ncbi:MAG: TIM barrel protein [Verrucomicrobiales bacterium]|nr:TIM barrel protein [Verrucomicrobiales bacterium]MCP5526500.1 TIM barrel protein [Verrucomicrobiales bacterium]